MDNTENRRYRRKYKYIKRRIKGLLIENAALCDEVAKIQESIVIVKEERKFLLRRLVEYESDSDLLLPKIEPILAPVRPKSKIKKPKTHEEGRSNSLNI